MTNETQTRRRNVPSYCPGYRRLQLRIAGILEVKRLARLAVVAGVLAGMLGCQASVPPPPVETVGQLSAGPSIWHAPTHAATDLTPSFGAVEGDDTATAAVTTVTRADAGGDANSSESPNGSVELPEVAPKTDGVTTGSVR